VLIAVLAGDLELVRLARHQLVGAEVVLEALDEHGRELRDVLDVIPDVVAFEHADDLVVGFTAIDELDAADHARAQQHFRTLDGSLADHADVERIAVAPLASGRELRDVLRAIGARDEAVERRRLRGGALGTIDAQVSGCLVDLVLDDVEGRDLDVRVDDAGGVFADFQAMPGMRAPAGKVVFGHGRGL
jgi:hypothetical protein